MRIVRWLAVPAMLIIGAGAVWISTSDSVGRSSTPTTARTSAAEIATVSSEVAATGTVQPAARYALAFGVAPTIASGDATPAAASSTRTWSVTDVAVGLGDSVTKGQVLATADTADVQADLDALAVQLADARQTLEDATDTRAGIRADTRAKLATAQDDLEVAELNRINARAAYDDASAGTPRRQAKAALIQAAAQEDAAEATIADLKAQLKGDFPAETQAVADAQAAVTDLESQVADLQEQLELATLRAPADGLVSAVDIVAGYAAPAGNAIVIDSRTLQVVADVVESDLASIAVGQDATVSLDALDLDAAGTVTAIAPTTTASSSSVVTFPVTVTLTDPDARVRTGMSTDVTIATAVATDVVAVPVAALGGTTGSYTVAVVGADGTIQQRAVTVGLVTESLAEIQSGVSAGEQVVTGTSSARSSTSSSGDQAGIGAGGLLSGGGGFPGGGPGAGMPPGAGR